MTATGAANSRVLERVERVGWSCAAVGTLLCVLGVVWAPRELGTAWLLSFTFWVGLPLGALAWLCVHALTGGRWGAALRPALGAAAATLPWMLPVFVLLWPFAGTLLHADELAGEAAHRRALYQPSAWGLRSLVLLGGWCAVAWRASRRGRPLGQGAAGVILIVHLFAVTVTAIDWVMALDPEFLSMSIGAKAFTGQMLASLAVAVVAVQCGRSSRDPDDEAGRIDQGNLLLALVLGWSYLAFTEWLIVWSANLPADAAWFAARGDAWTLGFGLALVLGHFVVPFVLLLSRAYKRRTRLLVALAAWLVAMQLGEQIWLITPTARPAGPLLGGWDLAALGAVGGLWVAWFSRGFRARLLAVETLEATA